MNGLGVTVLGLNFYENTTLLICLVLYVCSIIIYMARKFLQERNLEKSEITAALEMLADERDKKQKIRESHATTDNKF